MEAFEGVVQALLESAGYWVRPGYKVCLTKVEKRAIGRVTMPRVEIDLVAFRPGGQELLAVEVKSYLDSQGVRFDRYWSCTPSRAGD